MLLPHYRHVVKREGLVIAGDSRAVRTPSRELAPALLTSAVTALGPPPLAIGAGLSGQEIEGKGTMANVILGGLVTSTTLTPACGAATAVCAFTAPFEEYLRGLHQTLA